MRAIYADPEHWTTVTLMEFDFDDLRGWLVTGVQTQKRFRGNGYAADLFDRVCREADEEGVVLFLEIQPDGTGLDDEALENFYAKRGFEPFEPGDAWSRVRQPQRREP